MESSREEVLAELRAIERGEARGADRVAERVVLSRRLSRPSAQLSRALGSNEQGTPIQPPPGWLPPPV